MGRTRVNMLKKNRKIKNSVCVLYCIQFKFLNVNFLVPIPNIYDQLQATDVSIYITFISISEKS